MRRPRSHTASVVAGAVVIAAGFAIGLIERSQLPKGSVWLAVGAAALLVFVIRRLGRRAD